MMAQVIIMIEERMIQCLTSFSKSMFKILSASSITLKNEIQQKCSKFSKNVQNSAIARK
jgi:hypothetical protein